MSNTGTFTNTSTITFNSGNNPVSATSEVVNDGTIEVISGATATVSAPTIAGSGIMEMATGGALSLNAGTVLSGQTIAFADATGLLTLNIGSIDGFGAIINGFQPGDTITVQTTTPATFSLSGSVVLVVSGGITQEELTFANTAQAIAAVATSGALVDVSCFAAGTRISTARGEVKVEALRVGDTAITSDGSKAPIVWIGHRTVDCKRHPKPEAVWPVRISAGAFGGGMPKRTLTLSPDHAVFVNEVLIPVKYLINGTTIAQVKAGRVTYYHVELPRHDVLLAEGVPAESYLDTGDRANFGNSEGPVALHPDFASRRWEAEGCAPLVVTGPEVAAVRRWIETVAADLKFSGASAA